MAGKITYAIGYDTLRILMNTLKQTHMNNEQQTNDVSQTAVSSSNFIIKVADTFCEWEYGFTIDNACIHDFVLAIEKRFNIKKNYEKQTHMNVKIKVKKLENGSYMAFSICKPAYFAKTGTPGGVVYADSGGEAYEILKARLESKGYTVIES